jgi:hypothetical protein
MGNTTCQTFCNTRFQNNHLKSALIKICEYDQYLRKKWNIAEPESFSKHLILAIGWSAIIRMGESALNAAWTLTLHSTDLSFQKAAFEYLKRLRPCSKYAIYMAYLEDRILTRSGKRQKYGTQFRYVKKLRRITYFPISNIGEIDKRRHSIGLAKFSDYKRFMKQSCSFSTQPPV